MKNIFKKPSEEELVEEIRILKLKKAGEGVSSYDRLWKERNELKWGGLKSKTKSFFNSLGKVADAHNEYGLDMGVANQKKDVKSGKNDKKKSKVKAESDDQWGFDDEPMDFGVGNGLDPSKKLGKGYSL